MLPSLIVKHKFWQRICIVGALQAVLGTALFLSPASVRADPSGTGWEQVFSDDFNGTTLDTEKWSTCYHWEEDGGCTNSGNNELEWYQQQGRYCSKWALTLTRPEARHEWV